MNYYMYEAVFQPYIWQILRICGQTKRGVLRHALASRREVWYIMKNFKGIQIMNVKKTRPHTRAALVALAAILCFTVIAATACGAPSMSTVVAHSDASCGTVKKGISAARYGQNAAYFNRSGGDKINALDCGWWYNWGVRPGNEYISGEFVPMIWGDEFVTEENLAYVEEGWKSGKFTHLLTFNEPDLPGNDGLSANMTVDRAIELWPQLEESGIPLSSPAVSYYSPTEGNAWLDEFMERADEEDLRVDFIAVHLYQSFYSDGVVDELMDTVESLYEKYRLPIWLTEFGAIDIIARDSHASTVSRDCTETNAVRYVQQTLRRMEQSGYVERYAWFVDNFTQKGGTRPWEAPYTALYDDDDVITGVGEAYAGSSSVTALEIMTKTLSEAKAGEEYVQPLRIGGGTGDYTVTATSLPEGLELKDGALCGTPARADYYNVRLSVKDESGQSMTHRFILHVAE